MAHVLIPSGQQTRYYRSDLGEINDSRPIVHAGLTPENYKSFVRNPNWKVLLAKGSDVTAPYTRREFSPACKSMVVSGYARVMPGKLVLGTQHYAESSGRCFIRPVYNISSNMSDVALQDRAIAALKRKLAGQTEQFNSLVPLVELRELRKLIGGIAQLTEPLVRKLLKIQRSSGSSSTKAQQAGNAWLQWSFGISPMMNDAKQVADSLSEYYLGVPRTLRLTGTARKTWISGSGPMTTTGIYGTTLRYNTELFHELSYKVIAGVSITLRSDNNYTLLDHMGFQVGNLASAAWELTSYSWLVDYFTTAGDFLEDAFSRSQGFSTKYVVLDKLYRVSGRTHGQFVPSLAQYTSSTCKDGKLEYFEFTREKLSVIPARRLRFKEMDEVSRNAVNRLLNLSALLVTRR